MSTHALKSPSRFQRLRLCPGSYLAETKYPEQPSGPSAIDGTHTHTLLEQCIQQQRTAMSFMNKELEDHEGKFIVDGERANRVQVALDYVFKRAVDELQCGMHRVYSEVKLSGELAFGRDDMGGTCDIHIVDIAGRNLEIIDYKDGMGPVDLPCDQLEIYAIEKLSEFPEDTFDNVRLTIVQPKLAYRGEKGVTFIDVPAAELWEERHTYAAAAALCEQPDAPFNPGDLQCKYCAHKGACSALNGQMMQASGIAFQNLDVAKQAADKEPTELSNDQIRELIEAAPLLRQLLDAVEKEALRRLEAGQSIDGLKVVRGRGSRNWAFDEDDMAEKLKKFGIPKDSLYKTTLISPAQAEKVVWQKRDGTVKQLSDRQLKVLRDEYVKKSDGKLIVVSSADEREAVTISAAAMFTPVQETVPDWLATPDWLK